MPQYARWCVSGSQAPTFSKALLNIYKCSHRATNPKTQIMVFGFKNKPKLDKAKSEFKRPQSAQQLEPAEADTSVREGSGGARGAAKTSLFGRLRRGLSKTSKILNKDFGKLLRGKLDETTVEELETRLLMADVGVEATQKIVDGLHTKLKRKQMSNVEEMMGVLHAQMYEILEPCSRPFTVVDAHKPFVVLVVGVNGAGKTTTIGKLAKRLQQQGRSVMLAAGDTFRAAAVEQLQIWGERNEVPVMAQGSGADSASVIFDALQSARARNIDVLIADTAGRLHTQGNLMEELVKVQRVIRKLDGSAPHETMLVVDAGTGQNALNQAQQFDRAVGVTGITVTKLDGTAKGGILFAIANKLGIPIRYVGVGESVDDLRTFKAHDFVNALLARDGE